MINFFFIFYFHSILLYNTVLVLPALLKHTFAIVVIKYEGEGELVVAREVN